MSDHAGAGKRRAGATSPLVASPRAGDLCHGARCGPASQSWCGASAAHRDRCHDADLRRASSSGRVHCSSSCRTLCVSSCRICSASTRVNEYVAPAPDLALASLQEPLVPIVQVVHVHQVQLIDKIVELPEIQPGQGTQTSTSLGTTPSRRVTFCGDCG